MIKKREKNLVSVVITNYNNEKYIEACLDSIITQSYKNIELIIVDDNSTDKSIYIIEKWIKKYARELVYKNRLIFVKLPKNSGFSGAVTAGLYMTTGEYIAMQDGDDCSAENRIEKQVEYLKNNKGIRAVGSNYAIFKDSIKRNKIIPNFIKYGLEEIKMEYSMGENAVSYGTLLFEGELFDKIGGLTRRIDGAEDYEYITKLLPYGLDNIPETLYYYRIHESQRSREFYQSNIIISNLTEEELSVLFVLDSFNIGGTETHVLSLVKEYLKRGIKVTIIGGSGALEGEFKKLNCRIYNMKFPLVILTDKDAIRVFKENIKKIIEVENINIIHAHQSPSGALVIDISKEINIPCIFTVHGMYYYDVVADRLKECTKVISVSYPVYEWLLGFGIQSLVIPNGINYDEFNGESKGEDVREQFGIKETDTVALYCSRMAWGKIKTCENLIRVCRDLKRGEDIEIHALIVGDGPGYDELKRAGDRANRVLGKEIIHFAGSQIELPKFYDASDFVVGTGRVAIEAMATKKPIIATGNNGYFGIVTEENFEIAWKIYFGDHGSTVSNNAMYLYEDIKNIYLNKEQFKAKEEKIFEKSKSIFDAKEVANKVIEFYIS